MLIKKPFKKGSGGIVAPYYKVAAGLGLQTSLTAFWSMENTSWLDDTGNGSTLTATGSMTTASGKVGNAASFPGSASLSCASNTNLLNGGSSFSVQCWINTPGAAGQLYFNKSNNAFGQKEWEIGTRFVASNVWSVAMYNTSTTTFNVDSTVTVTTGAWHHIVLTFNVSGGVCKIYVDGTDATSGSPAVTGTMQSTASAPLNVGILGASSLSSGNLMDQCGFWKGRILSASDVTALYNSGNGLSYAAMA